MITPEEAIKIVHACMTADGGCRHCGESLVEVLKLILPEVDWSQALVDMDGPGQEEILKLLSRYL